MNFGVGGGVDELAEAITHAQLSDMPDTAGTNTDHDARYFFSAQNTCYVSPSYTDNNNSRKFSTVAAAASYANSQTPASNSKWLIKISAGEYDEQLTYYDYVYYHGDNAEVVIIKNTNRIIDITAENTGFKNITFEATGTSEIIRLNGAVPMVSNVRFFNCTFQGAGSANNVVNLNANAEALFTTVSFIQTSPTIDVLTVSNDANNELNVYTCIIVGNITINGGDSSFYDTRVIGSASVNNAANFTVNDCSVTFPTGTAVTLNTTGSFQAFETEITGAGLFMGTNYRAVEITAQPSTGAVNNCDFFYAIAAPDYLVYASVAFQFSGSGNTYQIGQNGNITNIGTKERRVASTVAEYNFIQDAIDSSSAGDVITIDAGTYTEQLTLKTGVILQGSNKAQVIVQQAADTLAFESGYTTGTIENITLTVSTAENRIMDITEGSVIFENCNFTNGYVAADNIVDNVSINFVECSFYKMTITDSNSTPTFKFLISRCVFTSSINVDLLRGQFLMYDSSFVKLDFNCNTGNVSFYLVRCTGNAFTNLMTITESNGGQYIIFRIINCELGIFAGYLLSLSVNQPQVPPEIVDNTFLNVVGNNDILINAGFTLSNVSLALNSMTKGIIGDGVFAFPNPIKQVGGTYDFYANIPAAFNGITSNNQTILLNKDITITTALAPPSYTIKIDGNHEFALIRSTGNPIMTISDNDDVTFENIDLLGSIDVVGNGARLGLGYNTKLDGMIDIQSGDASTLVQIDGAEVFGDATDLYCIRIADADPEVIVKRSYLKSGSVAAGAILFASVNNDNLKIAYSTIMHANLGTSNPFSQTGGVSVDYASHHSVYNGDPELAANFNNVIAAPLDVYDVNGDY